MILDPLSGDQCDDTGKVIIPYEKFRQRALNREAAKLHLPRPVPTIDREWDEDAGQYVDVVNLVTGISQGDPGDER